MIILFSGLDKQKGFNINIQKVINKELSNYKSMAIICASDDYDKNDIIIDGTSERIGVKEIFKNINTFYLIDKRTNIEDMIKILNKVDIIYLFGGNPLVQLEITKRINYKEIFKNKVLLGLSAGTMNLGKIGYYSKDEDYDKTFFYEGLGITNTIIEPHFDINNTSQVEEILNSSSKHKIIGLPNDSCIVIKESDNIEYINDYYVAEKGKIKRKEILK